MWFVSSANKVGQRLCFCHISSVCLPLSRIIKKGSSEWMCVKHCRKVYHRVRKSFFIFFMNYTRGLCGSGCCVGRGNPSLLRTILRCSVLMETNSDCSDSFSKTCMLQCLNDSPNGNGCSTNTELIAIKWIHPFTHPFSTIYLCCTGSRRSEAAHIATSSNPSKEVLRCSQASLFRSCPWVSSQ